MASLTSCYPTDNIAHKTNTNLANNVLHKNNMTQTKETELNS